jgi:3-oxoacyl-[acyl-carrier protein] reductase
MQQNGAQALALHTDVADEKSTKEMAAAVMQHFGRVDVLINNAAIFATVP